MAMFARSKIEELYSRFTDGFLAKLQSNDFYAYFLNSVRAGENNVSLYERFIERNVDFRWVEMIENTIIPLDNIIRAPQRYIKNEEEIVPIEMVRTITPESIRHLAQHTSMIAMVRGDEVTPNRMLNIIKEESFDTYENRFIYTLLQKLEYFLDKRLQALTASGDSQDLVELKLDGKCDAGHDRMSYSVAFSYLTPHAELSPQDLELHADVSELNAMQRIERVRRILADFRSSQLIKDLHGCALVRPPLNMTNVLTKNQNFRKAVDLWMFIERYDEVGYTVNRVERQGAPAYDYMDELFSVLALQYVVMKKNSGHMGDLGDYTERKSQVEPNVVKKDIDDILDNFDLEIDEIRRIFVDRVERKKRKQQAEFKKVRDIIARAMSNEAEKLSLAQATRKSRAQRIAERAERIRKAEQARIEAEQERQRREAQRAAKLAQRRLAAEKLLAGDTGKHGFETGEELVVARYRRSYLAKLIQADAETKQYYSDLKNALLSYGTVHARTSWDGESFKSGRTHLAKMAVRGKTLCLYLALDPAAYEGTKYRVSAVSGQKFAQTPCLFKVNGMRRAQYARDLIKDACEQAGLVWGEAMQEDFRYPFEDTEALIARGLIKDMTCDETPAEAAPVEAVPAEAAPVEAVPVEETPVEATAVEETPVEEAPTEGDIPTDAVENEKQRNALAAFFAKLFGRMFASKGK